MEGWISLHRKVLDNPVVCKDADHVAIWVYLLLNATHSDIKMMFGKECITLKPGQLITGRKSISMKFNISESKVQRVLKSLEIEQQIEQQTNNKHRLITIVNWALYQDRENKNNKSEHQIEQPVNNERTPSEQQVNTNNNVNNVNNVNKKEKHIGEIENFFESAWSLYPNKNGKASVSKKQKEVLSKIGIEEITRCIDRYVSTKESWKAFKNGSTFFNSGYIDFLDNNYIDSKKVEVQKKEEIKKDNKIGMAVDLSCKSWNGEYQ